MLGPGRAAVYRRPGTGEGGACAGGNKRCDRRDRRMGCGGLEFRSCFPLPSGVRDEAAEGKDSRAQFNKGDLSWPITG